MLNIATLLESSAREYNNDIAIVFGDQRLSYAELDDAANRIANGLRAAGIQKGDRVVVMGMGSGINCCYMELLW